MKKAVNRRQFLTTLGAGVVAARIMPLYGSPEPSANSAFAGEAPKFWFDPRFAKQKKMP